MGANRYAPPNAFVDDAVSTQASQASPPIWNPNAAANWCLLFSPIFGSWLHMKNWQALGEDAKAKSQKTWLAISILVIVCASAGAAIPGPVGIGLVGRLAAFVLLLAWYFGSARAQARYVKQRFGDDYPRKGWGRPLLLGVGAYLAVFAISFVLVLVATLAGFIPVA